MHAEKMRGGLNRWPVCLLEYVIYQGVPTRQYVHRIDFGQRDYWYFV